MRRIVWLLGLLAIVVVGTVWWSSRNAIRLEPLDAQRFAQMSETEQVEWLIEQILARSERTDWFTQLLKRLTSSQQEAHTPFLFVDVEAIGTACVEYELPRWLSLCALYPDGTSPNRDHLRVYEALLQARKGDWQAAEQTVQRIQRDAFRALTLTHLGCLQAKTGRADAALQSFEQSLELLRKIVAVDQFEKYILRLIIRHYPEGQRDELLRKLAAQARSKPDAVVVAEAYRARGEISQLRKMLADAHGSLTRLEVRVKLLQALIEQGQANEALQEIVRRGAMSDTVAIQILDSLYQKGYREEAQRLADALSDKLMKSGLIARQMPLNHFGVNPVKHFGTVQVATRYGQLRVQITEPDRTFGALVGMYAKWGLHTKTERLLSALPPDRKLFYRIHLASIYQAAGQPARARQDLERVLQEIPRVLRADKFDTQVALMLVACAYAQLGDYPHALTLAQRISPRHQREVLRAILVDRLEARHYSEERRLFWSEWVEVAQ